MIVDPKGDLVQRLTSQCPSTLVPQLHKILMIISSAKTMIDVINAGVMFTSSVAGHYVVSLGISGNSNCSLHFDCINDVVNANNMYLI